MKCYGLHLWCPSVEVMKKKEIVMEFTISFKSADVGKLVAKIIQNG